MAICVEDIKVGTTYQGVPKYSKGFGSHLTVLSVSDTLVVFRNEVSANPPKCYVSAGTMEVKEFAAWANHQGSTG